MREALAPVGLLGGTFNPVHYGHLRLAEEAREALALSEICLIPAGHPPHRALPDVSAEQRLEMARLAIADNPAFTLDDSEVVAQGKSYTVLTLERLRARYGPHRPLVLILGADAFQGLPSWHQWQRLLTLTHIVVANRPGFSLQQPALPGELDALFQQHQSNDAKTLTQTPAGKIITLSMAPLAISASLIRTRLESGRSVRYLLPDSVLDYIERHHLYSRA